MTSAQWLGLGLLLVGLTLLAGCSLVETPMAPGPTSSSSTPQFLRRLPPVAKTTAAEDSILYGEKLFTSKDDWLILGDDFTGINKFHAIKGSVAEPTVISMAVPVYGDIVAVLSQVDFGPHGVVFQKPCDVTLSYKNADLTGVNEKEICAWYVNEDTGQWEGLEGRVDTKKKTVKFKVLHFSRYALASR